MAFQELDRLERLYVFCQIAYISLSNFSFSDLSHNRLTRIDTMLLKKAESLHTLNLSANDITTLGDGLLWAARQLQHLDLSHNRLQTVSRKWLFVDDFSQLRSL